jgi:D-psicose/D-tagatose/L-ribulose 3-epimerase
VNPIGVNSWVWVSPPTNDHIRALSARVAEWGFDILELPVENPGDWDPEIALEAARENGIGVRICAVMPPGRDPLSDLDDERELTRAYLRHCIDVAATVGSPAIGGPMYSSVGRTWLIDRDERKAILKRLRAELRPIADYAGERGVTLALEPLNRFETSVANTAEQVLEICDAIGSPACGLLLDTFHMNIEEKDPAGAIRAAGSRLVHFHACGTDRGAPGDDHLDWDSILAALRAVSYKGAVCIESFTVENEVIARAAAIWRPLAASQDELATRGLVFLRKLLSKDAAGAGYGQTRLGGMGG